jgi:putative ABC transport system substrate-binding protein
MSLWLLRGTMSKKEITMRLSSVGLVGTLILAVLMAPLAADAQPGGKVWRIGVLLASPPAVNASFVEAFWHRLRELGYVEGQNIAVESRWSHGQVEAVPALAAELVRLPVDLIFAGGTTASLAARDATRTIPIVFAGVADPVGAGLVASLAQPGGNITGLSTQNAELGPKRLELLREVAPRQVARVGVVFNPLDAGHVLGLRELEGPARALGLTLRPIDVRSPDAFAGAFGRMAAEGVEAVVVLAGPLTNTHATRLVQLTARTRLPAIYGLRGYVEAGGLMSYGVDFPEMHRRAATYVDKILKGAKPADLPVEQPTKFELVLNRQTAQGLGFTFPPTLLILADEVIQ